VRVEEIALVFQLAHGAADGGRRDAEPEFAGNGLTARGLSGFDIGLDYGLEHPELARTQL
jgi:hypothetical protein